MLRAKLYLFCALSLLLLAVSGSAQRIAFDEFDGKTRAGFVDEGLGSFGDLETREQNGRLIARPGTGFRALQFPPERSVVWYTVTLRMRAPIDGRATLSPVSAIGRPGFLLGFDSAQAEDESLWWIEPEVQTTGLSGSESATFLQRIDLVNRRWDGWALAGDGRALLSEDGLVHAAPDVEGMPWDGERIAALCLSVECMQELEIERVALAASAREALLPARAGDTASGMPPLAPAKLSRDLQSFADPQGLLRSADQIAFCAEWATESGGPLSVLEAALQRAAPARRVTLGRCAGARTHGEQPCAQIRADRADIAVLDLGPELSPQEFAQRLRLQFAGLRAQGLTLLVCTPTRLRDSTPAERLQLDALAQTAREVAAELKAGVCELELAYTEQLRTARVQRRNQLPFCDEQGARTPAGDQWLAEQLGFAITRQLFREAPVCELALVPYPTTLRLLGGSVDLQRNLLVIAGDSRLLPCAEWLADSLARSTGYDTRVGSQGVNEFRIVLDWQELEFQVDENTTRQETYTLSINEEGVRLGGGSAQALAHAGATLLQLIGDAQATRKDQSLLSLPYLRIYDQPAMEYRGLSLNLARRPLALATLERVIDVCGYYKLRYLELELSDDQAFLFPSRAFSGLAAPGESFTREQWLGLAAFAHARGVELVPGLSLPNQAAQLIALRPDVFGSNPRLSSTIDIASPTALDAAEELLLELCELFPNSRYVQLGSAACDRDALTASPHFAGSGAADADELIADFFARVSALLYEQGRRAIVRGGLSHPLSQKLPRELLVAVSHCERDPVDALSSAGFEILNTAAGSEAHGWNPRAWPRSDLATQAACVLWGTGANLRGAQIPISLPEKTERVDALLSQVALFAERLWNPSLRTTQEAFSERRVRTERAFRRIAR